jgi:hypothetical protein
MTDSQIIEKALSVVGALNPEQQAARELEVLAALRTVLTEMELARLIVLGLKSLDEQPRQRRGSSTTDRG